MKKDKEWLKGLINEEGIVMDMHLLGRLDEQYWKNENIKINKGRLFYLIDQLDEPEKPVIPQFVANWIEEERVNLIGWHTEIPERFFLILGYKLHYTTLASTDISDWVFDGNEEKLYQALKYGYEVKKEKLYRIKFSDNQYASRFNDGKINSILTDEELAAQYTEAEIKKIDERLMIFAEEVTE